MKQSYFCRDSIDIKPKKIMSINSTHLHVQSSKGNGTSRQTTTPLTRKSQNSQFEVKISKRSISFFEDNSTKSNYPNQKIELNDSQSDSLSDSHNIWGDECQQEDLFQLFQLRFCQPPNKKVINQRDEQTLVDNRKAIVSFKKLFGYNLMKQKIGMYPFYYTQQIDCIQGKQNENTRQAKFQIQETRLPFSNINYINNSSKIPVLKEKK